MIDIESDSIDILDDLPVGSRMFLVRVFDPVVGGVIASATVVEATRFDEIDLKCIDLKMPFYRGMLHAAAGQVVDRIWNGDPPDGFAVQEVYELSKRELQELITLSTAEREANDQKGMMS